MPPCFNRFSHHSIEVRDDNVSILFILCCIISFFLFIAFLFFFFFFFSCTEPSIFKLEISYVYRSPVICSLFRPANSVGSMWRPPEKTYLIWSPNLIFKCLGFDCQVKLNFFLWLLFWASSVQFQSTYIKWKNRPMGFANLRSENIVGSHNHR